MTIQLVTPGGKSVNHTKKDFRCGNLGNVEIRNERGARNSLAAARRNAVEFPLRDAGVALLATLRISKGMRQEGGRYG